MPLPARPLRILIVTHNYPRSPGDPAGAFVARIAQGAAERGHQVQVIAPHAPGLAIDEQSDGVGLHRFRYAPDRFERVAYTGGLHQGTLRSPLAALAFPGFLLAFSRAVRAAVRRFQPDLIHAHWWFPGGWLASGQSVPYLITCHGSDVRLLDRGYLVRTLARRVFRRARAVTTVSEFLARDLTTHVPEAVSHMKVTPMPVDTIAFAKGLQTPKALPARILYAGNLVPSKGVDVLLRAAGELTRRGVAYHLKILGQGPERGRLESLAREQGIAAQVTWSAHVPQQQMAAEYGASTVTVLPSRGHAEGLGLTLVEALLAGSAVIGTAAGGIPEVVRDEQTGLIARDGDWVHLADQIERMLTDATLRERLTKAGQVYALEKYDQTTNLLAFLGIYHGVAEHHANR
jgi:glycosyltransferase involved in cell wall biosynthesis